MRTILIGIVLILMISTPAMGQGIFGNIFQHQTREKELLGPNGLKTTCGNLDEFVAQNTGALATEGNNALYSGSYNIPGGVQKRERYNSGSYIGGSFNVPFVNWTPEIVEFLKNALDLCGIGGPKNLFDEIYKISLNTQKFNEELAEREKQNEIEKSNQEIARQNHISNIKSGKEKINSVSDASIYYSAQPFTPIIVSPLLTPDKGYYYGEVTIDFQENKSLLRIKIENYVDMNMRNGSARLIPLAYAFLRTDNKTVSFDPSLLRIGEHIQVLGKYIGNKQYRTVSGEIKVSPEIQVLYMGGS